TGGGGATLPALMMLSRTPPATPFGTPPGTPPGTPTPAACGSGSSATISMWVGTAGGAQNEHRNCRTVCVGRGRTSVPGAGGGGGGPGATSVIIDCTCGSTCGKSSGARINPPTRSTCPVTPAHVLHIRFPTGAEASIACSNITSTLLRCADTRLPWPVGGWI